MNMEKGAYQKREERKERIRNVEVSKVLENLSKNYKKEFPFLLLYKEIDMLYSKIDDVDKYFLVGILRQITLELQHTINTIDKKELDYYITKRFADESGRYFIGPVKAFKKIKETIPTIIRRHYVSSLIFVENYMRTELDQIRFDINEYSVKNDTMNNDVIETER